MKKKFVTILKGGGKFTPHHVECVRNQTKKHLSAIEEFICYTDVEFSIPGVITRPLIDTLPGKWSMQELPREPGHVIGSGLDIVFMRDCNWLYDLPVGSNDYYGTRPFGPRRPHKQPWQNGLQLYKGDWSRLYHQFDNHQYHTMKLEQHYTYLKLLDLGANIKYLQDEGLIQYSYKQDVRDKHPPLTPHIICFHGVPDPWEVEEFKDRFCGK